MRSRSRRTSLLLLLALAACGDGNEGGQGLADLAEVDEHAYAISHILYSTQTREDDEARKRAWQAYRKLVAGGRFEDVVKSSDGDAKDDGGFEGFLPVHDTAFHGAMQVLVPGQISPPVKTAIGYQIIKRHSFEEARRLDERYSIAPYGFYVPWEGQRGGGKRTKEQARKVALATAQQIRQGEKTLGEAAAPFWAAVPVPANGFLGLVRDRVSHGPVWGGLAGLPPGGVSEPIETPKGWLVAQRGPILRSLVRHILIPHLGSSARMTRTRRTREEALALASSIQKEASADPDRWNALVKKHSEDASTSARNGTLGVISNGIMPPAVEAAVFATEPGKVAAQVVESEFGFHVLLRVN